MVESKEKDTIKYTEGYVAFIDILGFKNFVNVRENAEKTKELFDFVAIIKDLFNNQEKWGIKMAYFSDSIVITTEDNWLKLLVPISFIDFYLQNKLNLSYRGGIYKGEYYHKDGIAFGPAINEAYMLEQRAIYPRIILSDNIEDYVDELEVFVDFDGQRCLNVFSRFYDQELEEKMEDNKKYSDSEILEKIIKTLAENKEKISQGIWDNIKEKYTNKYFWNIIPHNYTCDYIIKHTDKLDYFTEGYRLSGDEKNRIKSMKISPTEFIDY